MAMRNETANTASSILESIFHNITDAIVLLDHQGYVTGANPAAESMTGLNLNDPARKAHFCEICKGVATCTEEASCDQCFKKAFSMPSFEMVVRTKAGDEFPVTASSTHLPGDTAVSVVLVLRDMSEQHRTERERFRRMMTNYVIQAQEEERKRVSRDLHDGVGQALYSILVGLKVLNHLKLEESVKNHLDDVQQMTTRALEEVKNMAVELRPSALDDLGLVPAIRSYCRRFEQTFGVETDLHVTGSKRRYASIVETALYRICQEAMTNAAKYADTDKIAVFLSDTDNRIILRIQDFGCGFDTNQIRVKGTGLGLYGMKERASLLGGHADIQSVIGEGTTIVVSIELNGKGEPLHVDPSSHRG